MKNIFSHKHIPLTAEQIVSLSLFACCFILMTFFAIVRFFGLLWFQSDLSNIEIPSIVWQNVINNALLCFELIFVYKTLINKSKWHWGILISVLECIIGHFIPMEIAVNIFHMVCMFVIPFAFNKTWKSLINTTILYAIELLYACIFLLARTGGVNSDASRDFYTGILTVIDFKLLIVSIYLLKHSFKEVKRNEQSNQIH